jgi:acetylornithine deacetylase/succinyl-diaminopimelate desuccinylase family protein
MGGLRMQSVDLIKDDEVIGLLKKLIPINSENPPGNENAIAEFIGRFLAECGLEVEFYEPEKNRVSVVGTLKGKKPGPTLILNGHTDTKPAVSPFPTEEQWSTDPFVPTIRGEKLYGLGACDMKGGIAAILTAVKAFATQKKDLIAGNLIFQGAADEEAGSTFGTEYLVGEGVAGDFAIVAEGTSLNICPAELGALWFTIHVKGERGHASMPWYKVNAIDKTVEVITALKRYIKEKQERVDHRYFPRHPTLNLGIISGGFHPGSIPDGCSLTFDVRLIPGETKESVRKEIEGYMTALMQQDPQLKLSFEYFQSGGAEPTEIDDNHPIVKVLARSYHEVTGNKAELSGMIGFSDAGWLVNAARIPTVIFGPGSMEQAHTVNEYVVIKEVCTAARVYLKAINDLLKE